MNIEFNRYENKLRPQPDDNIVFLIMHLQTRHKHQIAVTKTMVIFIYVVMSNSQYSCRLPRKEFFWMILRQLITK